MKSESRWAAVALTAWLALWAASGGAAGDPFTGRLVDAGLRQPISGALVSLDALPPDGNAEYTGTADPFGFWADSFDVSRRVLTRANIQSR